MAEVTLEQAKKSLGIDQGDPKTSDGLTETRRGFNITHPMGNFANPELGMGQGISFIKANKSQHPIWFPGFMIKFSDSFTQNVNKEKVFGRMDPLQVFESTERRMTFSWQVVSVSQEEGKYNIGKINDLIKALYPDYRQSRSTGGYYVTTSALIGINFHGLAHGRLSSQALSTDSSGASAENDVQYLFGYIESLTIDHDFENGVFENQDTATEFEGERARTPLSKAYQDKGSASSLASSPLIAKAININVTFSPIHPETLGWDAETGSWISTNRFPYLGGVKLDSDAPQEYPNTLALGSTFEVSEQKRAAYEAYQAQLRAQEASILGSQNPWERAGNKIAGAYNKTVDFFDSLVATEGEDPNTGL